MATDPELDSRNSKGLKGLWNKSILGRQDVHGNSFLSVAKKEVLNNIIGYKEWFPKTKPGIKTHGAIIAPLISAALAVPIGLTTGVISETVEPAIEYEFTQTLDEMSAENHVISLSRDYEGHYIIITQDSRPEVYKFSAPSTYSEISGDPAYFLLSQSSAITILERIHANLESAHNYGHQSNYSTQYTVEDIRSPLISESRTPFRHFDNYREVTLAFDLSSGYETLADLVQSDLEQTVSGNYGLTQSEIRELQEDYDFDEGLRDGFIYGSLGLLMFYYLGGGMANAYGNTRPSNGSKRNKKESAPKP